ncbi:hypothetical protein OSB04_013560 [Centaurea solstitialis]|uniref:BHLH domain-containing protein n=1 Tax=Centaurea solstitialis TaxID=347529 RepID=A0AA38TRG2_9ASTR|nr:hypothetical protein OSB04_013560 [Centaurea solstitialis]
MAELQHVSSRLHAETEFDNFIPTDPVEKYCFDYQYNDHFATDLQLPMPPAMSSYGLNQSAIGGSGAEFVGYDAMDPNVNLIWNQHGDQDFKGRMFTEMIIRRRRHHRNEGGSIENFDLGTEEEKRNEGEAYALRSLVPNITKMDKASIVGDAARYIQELQTQARNLKTDIATIEAAKDQRASSQNSKKIHNYRSLPLLKKISKMDMFQVDEKGYYVRLVCNTGQGVAVSLHKALESITSFQVQSSNLATVGDNFVLTFTLNVTVCEFDINLPNLKLWLAGAFLNQGFEFIAFPSA